MWLDILMVCLSVFSCCEGQRVEIIPREAVRKVGGELLVLCKVPYVIDTCRMTVGPASYRLKPGDSEGDVVYYGQGLEVGECGAHINNIKDEWNGNVTCVLPPQIGSVDVFASMRLIVAKAPKQPILLTPPQSALQEGDVLMAQCVAADGRPAAKLSWLLDDEELLVGVQQPIVTLDITGDLQTISRNVSRTLAADDGGRTLVCRVEHEAMPSPYDIKRQLVVHYPPKRQEAGPLMIFGLKLNAEGRLNVSVRANPPPRAEWTTGEQRLVAPQQSDDKLMAALEPLHLGGGYYNITLVLARVTTDKVNRTYYLRVSNDLGQEDIAVRISTKDEPADLGYLTVNEKAMVTDLTTVQDVYDRFGTYEFTEDEQAKFACFKRTPNVSVLSFLVTNINANRTISTGAQYDEKVEIYLKLTADYDNAYVDCTLTEMASNLHLSIRIYTKLIFKPASLGFRINGLTLASIPKQGETNWNEYVYEYYPGELLTINSWKDDAYGGMRCVGDNKSAGYQRTKTWIGAREKYENKTLDCFTKEISSGDDQRISLYLVPNELKQQPFVRGISMANILYKFYDITSTVIMYEYDDNEDLDLICYTYNPDTKWKYDSAEVTVINRTTPYVKETKYGVELHAMFKLNAGVQHAVISCMSAYGGHEVDTTIELVRKKKSYNVFDTECGSVTLEGYEELIAGGVSAKLGEVPWHAGIYKKTTRPYNQICGGSLISNNIIISAAHCFWDKFSQQQKPAENFAVAVGKLYRPWTLNSTNEEPQKSDVQAIYLPEHFQGSVTNTQDDIAILLLRTEFRYTDKSVRPVCVDFDANLEKNQLQPGNMGKVAGWGVTDENGNPSQVLKVVKLPFVDAKTCIAETPFYFHPQITSGKFCAGFKSAGRSVCKGDSGGGLVFPKAIGGKVRFFLQGIVSTAPTNDDNRECNVNDYTGFTRLRNHEDFIKQNWGSYGQQHHVVTVIGAN